MLHFAALNTIVTGASRGIGLEFCNQALASGARVLAVARMPEDSPGLKELQKKFPETLQVLKVDVSHPEAGEMISSSVGSWGHVDVLINNAGVYHKGESADDFSASFHINSVAPFQISKTLLPNTC